MHAYNPKLKQNARNLRSNMTDAEILLWSRVRRKQILGVQFYRQKPIGPYIVDFFAPGAGVVVEVDGSQHYESGGQNADVGRDRYLDTQGLEVLRFDNRAVLKQTDAVVEAIFQAVLAGLGGKIPNPP